MVSSAQDTPYPRGHLGGVIARAGRRAGRQYPQYPQRLWYRGQARGMKIKLPPPAAFGLPDKFPAWREDQEFALQLILDADTQFIGLNMPVGSGKSLAASAAAVLTSGRTAYLTATKGLQDQIGADFPFYWD